MTQIPHRELTYAAPARAWTVVVLLLVAYIVASMDRQILSLLVQPIRNDLGITDTEISLLQGFAFVITFTLLGVFLGRVADRGNRRNLIVIGMAVWCVATVACGFARNFAELFVARMMVGVGEAALSPAAYSLIGDYFQPSKRGRAMCVYTMATFVGSGVAIIAGALAILSTMGASTVDMPLIGVLAVPTGLAPLAI
jgi:MFS family permease